MTYKQLLFMYIWLTCYNNIFLVTVNMLPSKQYSNNVQHYINAKVLGCTVKLPILNLLTTLQNL